MPDRRFTPPWDIAKSFAAGPYDESLNVKLSSTRIRQVSDEALTEAAASADRPPGGIATLTRLPHAAVDSLPREGSGPGSISFNSFC